MTPLQMHIAVRQGVQQVAANKTFKYLDQELDLILNKQQQRLIQAQLKQKTDDKGRPTGGFEVSQAGADIIRPLIVTSYSLVPYIKDDRMYECFLPPDYAYLLSDWSYSKLLCNDYTPKETSDTLYITRLRQEMSGLAASPYYVTLSITLGGTVVTLPDDLIAFNSYKGLTRKEQIYELVQFLALNGGWYWERVMGSSYPGYYIKVSTDPSSQLNAMITIDGATTANVKTSLMNMTSHRGEEDTKFYDNRLVASDNISGLNSTAFYKSSFYSPISELSAGILYIYRDTSFIVSEVGISYIRKARPISLSLNTKCELPEEFHDQVCDLAVEYIKGRLENYNSWKQTKEDNDSRVLT